MLSSENEELGEIVLPDTVEVIPEAVVAAVKRWRERAASSILEEQETAYYWLNRIREEWKV